MPGVEHHAEPQTSKAAGVNDDRWLIFCVVTFLESFDAPENLVQYVAH